MPLSVTEYAGTGGAAGSIPTGADPALASQDVAIPGTSVALQTGTSLVRLCSDTACRVSIGAPATATSSYLPANVVEWRVVRGKLLISTVA